MTWEEHAVCRTEPTGTFFPWEKDEALHDIAKAICATCPVIAECLDEAMVHHWVGVWGGTTDRERRSMRRRRVLLPTGPKAAPTTRPTCGTNAGEPDAPTVERGGV